MEISTEKSFHIEGVVKVRAYHKPVRSFCAQWSQPTKRSPQCAGPSRSATNWNAWKNFALRNLLSYYLANYIEDGTVNI